jgi:hypothetical protein
MTRQCSSQSTVYPPVRRRKSNHSHPASGTTNSGGTIGYRQDPLHGILGAAKRSILRLLIPGLALILILAADTSSRAGSTLALAGLLPVQATSSLPSGTRCGLREILEAIRDATADAKDKTDASIGPLSDPNLTDVENDLDDVESMIDQLFDPNQNPVLVPVDAGSIDTSVDPTTLPEYADTCSSLAQDALDVYDDQLPRDYDAIGSDLKTLESLLPAYCQLAGIE